MEPYKKYNYSKKTVKINGLTYEAIFPEKHSTLDGLVHENRDLNAGDSYANIRNYQTTCHVLWKGEKDWETLYVGPSGKFKINNSQFSGGIFPLLFELESRSVRKNFLKRKEISELKKAIKEKTARLEELTSKNLVSQSGRL